MEQPGRPRVFVVQPIHETALEVLREVADVTVHPYMDRQITTDELVANAKRNDYLFIMHETLVPAEVFEANPDLKGIGVMGGRSAFVDFAAARAHNIPVVTAARSDTRRCTADLTVAMILALAYGLVDADRYTRHGHFKQEQTIALLGLGCEAKTVGMLGLGTVAEIMVPRIRAFGMKVIYTKRTRLTPEQEQALGVEWVDDRDALLRRSDYVCVLVNYTASTDRFIGARELALMKPTAYLINTGRAWIVDQQALLEALRNHTIAGAALDVFWDEPPVTHDPYVPPEFRALDNVILSPHNGGATVDNRGANQMSCAKGIAALIRGEQPEAVVDCAINRAHFGSPEFYPS